MVRVPDAASVAACLWLESRMGRRVGPSTGTNIIGTLLLAEGMQSRGKSGSIASLICDGGDRYADTIYDPAWRRAHELDLGEWSARFREYDATGRFPLAHGGVTGLSVCEHDIPAQGTAFDI
jgi:cysteine synthase